MLGAVFRSHDLRIWGLDEMATADNVKLGVVVDNVPTRIAEDVGSDELFEVAAGDVDDNGLEVAEGVNVGEEPADAAILEFGTEAWRVGDDMERTVRFEVIISSVNISEPLARVIVLV